MPQEQPRKTEYKLAKAFQRCFCDGGGNLTPEGSAVLAYLRDYACGKGELGKDGSPYFYDQVGRMDATAITFVAGKRAMFDQIVKYLAIDARMVLNLIALEKDPISNLKENLEI